MKKIGLIIGLITFCFITYAQETLQTVTDRGNVTTNSLQIGGNSVNANTTKLYINNPSGKNFALSSGANMITEQGFHIYNWTDNQNSPLFSIDNFGNVGIGRFSPSAKLDVNGNILISNSSIPMGLITEMAGTATPLLNMSVNFREANKIDTYVGAAFRIDTRGENQGTPLFQWLKRDAQTNNDVVTMSLTSSGNLGIGTTTPAEKLSVNGKIRAREIKVETTNWPDYVFAKDYKLPTLQETADHIKEKGHLPGIPSAAEVKANGVDLGEMNAKLLQKIEELTLYLIEIKKDNKNQKESIQLLKESNEKLIAEMAQIKSKL